MVATRKSIWKRGAIEKRDGYRLWVGGPVPRGYSGVTLGSLVIMREDCRNPESLLAHELAHVEQFRELGAVRFLWQYSTAYLRFRLQGYSHRAAYWRIPLEVEARWKEACATAERRGTTPPPKPGA